MTVNACKHNVSMKKYSYVWPKHSKELSWKYLAAFRRVLPHKDEFAFRNATLYWLGVLWIVLQIPAKQMVPEICNIGSSANEAAPTLQPNGAKACRESTSLAS